MSEKKVKLDYLVGTMIEVQRGALTADEIAETAQFFSFGTNDLTQTTFGLSRDDAGRFLPAYIKQHVLERDPFVELDREGVGGLIHLAIGKGRATKPELKHKPIARPICGMLAYKPRFSGGAYSKAISTAPSRIAATISPMSDASRGCRLQIRHARSSRPNGRARIGDPSRYRLNSSDNVRAES